LGVVARAVCGRALCSPGVDRVPTPNPPSPPPPPPCPRRRCREYAAFQRTLLMTVTRLGSSVMSNTSEARALQSVQVRVSAEFQQFVAQCTAAAGAYLALAPLDRGDDAEGGPGSTAHLFNDRTAAAPLLARDGHGGVDGDKLYVALEDDEGEEAAAGQVSNAAGSGGKTSATAAGGAVGGAVAAVPSFLGRLVLAANAAHEARQLALHSLTGPVELPLQVCTVAVTPCCCCFC
jgi:hypothetical protein